MTELKTIFHILKNTIKNLCILGEKKEEFAI